jgi:alpha-methylacyl-CoA racemase
VTAPLSGVRVLELAGLGPAPLACKLLSDLGADVLRLDRPGSPPGGTDGLGHGRASLTLDLATPEGLATARELVGRADVLVEGFRPGVAERLSLGPSDCHALNPGLVYARMTGWGQDGPLATTAGHDINYLAVTGGLHAIGTAADPLPPLNLVADFGGGSLFLVVGVLAALQERHTTGRGRIVDTAMVDGTSYLLTLAHRMLAAGQWRDERAANLLDGGAPFYRTYRCADGRHVAVGALEPPFYAALLAGLGLDPAGLPAQYDRSGWPALVVALGAAFGAHDRDHWERVFTGTDACVTPVRSLTEAVDDPQLAARGVLRRGDDGVVAPAPAPRFDGDEDPTGTQERISATLTAFGLR